MSGVTSFTTKRENRLWLWTVAVAIAIYSTLLLDLPVLRILQEYGLVEAFYVLGLILVITTIATQGFQVRPGGRDIAITIGVIAVYLLVFTRMSYPGERTHLIEYGIVAVFFYEPLSERSKAGTRVPAPALLAIVGASLLGVVDEWIQRHLPGRVFDLRDMLFNVLAATMAVGTCALLARVRRR